MRLWRYPILTASSYSLLRLPRIPQATSYGDYDAADLLVGNPDVATRFVTVGTNLVNDTHTGLQWIVNPACIVPGSATGAVALRAMGTWSDAVNYVVGDLVAYTVDVTTLFFVALQPSGPADVPVAPDSDPTTWAQTTWTASAANLTTPAKVNWTAALEMVAGLNYAGVSGATTAGSTGWRLPSSIECLSLMDLRTGSKLPSWAAGLNAGGDYAWSLESHDASGASAWRPGYGYINSQVKTNLYLVTPVRSLY